MRTFFASGIAARSTSTLAIAKTSAEADIFTKKSAIPIQLAIDSPNNDGNPSIDPLNSIYAPCTVAFAPMAVMAPNVPTMKYWNSLLEPSLLLLLYAANEGILVVSLPPMPLKGESNELDADTSERLRRWAAACEVAARRAELLLARSEARARLLALDESAGMAVEGAMARD